MLRSILNAVGELEGGEDWQHMRLKVTRELINKLHGMKIEVGGRRGGGHG